MPENHGSLKENALGTGSQVSSAARLMKNIAKKISGVCRRGSLRIAKNFSRAAAFTPVVVADP